MSLAETMREFERAGSAQTRKTYARHGAVDPMFGVSFATLKLLMKRHEVVRWLKSKSVTDRCAGWTLPGQLAQRDEALPDDVFEERLAEIERTIHAAPDAAPSIETGSASCS